jgi:predicted small secreted protein
MLMLFCLTEGNLKMRYFISLFILFVSGLVSGCNTIGGFGQDLSETGKALDRAAYWSQNQIDDISNEESNAGTSNNNYNSSDLVVQEPDTLRQY